MRITPYAAAAALVAGPIVVGALLFAVIGPHVDSGVFLSTGHSGTWMYRVSRYSEGTGLSFRGIGSTAVELPGSHPEVFLVGRPDTIIGSGAASAQLYVFVVNHADQDWQPTLLPVPATVQQLHARVHRLVSDELVWTPETIGFRHYRDVLSRLSAPRDSIELMAGVVISDHLAGVQRLYAFRIGPQ